VLRAPPQRELAPYFAVDIVVLRRDPAASLKSRIELGHFCRRNKRRDWLLFPLHHELRANTSHKSQDAGSDGDRPAADGADVDGFEALIAYAENTEASIRYLHDVRSFVDTGRVDDGFGEGEKSNVAKRSTS